MTRAADDLLVAAAVLPLARELRKQALVKAVADNDLQWREGPEMSSNMTLEDRAAYDNAMQEKDQRAKNRVSFEKEWLSQHPVEEFARGALEQLERVADAISSRS